MKISIFAWNEKYFIELEAAQYKQTFKISQDSVNGLEDIKRLCDDAFIRGVMERFSLMHADFKIAFDKIQKP